MINQSLQNIDIIKHGISARGIEFKLVKAAQTSLKAIQRVVPLHAIVKFCCIVSILTLYFSYHAFVGGNSNYFSENELSRTIESKQKTLNKLKHYNQKCAKEIELINGAKVDVDFLEELARKQLNYSYSDECVATIKHKNL